MKATYALVALLFSTLAAQGQSPQPQLALKRVVGIQYPWFEVNFLGKIVVTSTKLNKLRY